MTTVVSWKSGLIREGRLILVFLSAAFLWFIFWSRIIPVWHESLSRLCYHDYSYLWNGAPDKMQVVARFGAQVILILMPVWVLIRSIKRVYRSVVNRGRRSTGGKMAARTLRHKQIDAAQVFNSWLRDLFIAIFLFAAAALVFYFGNRSYSAMKIRYFNEIVMVQPRYAVLSENERSQARAQYESVYAQDMLPSMVKAYGIRAGGPYYLSSMSFWAMIWGVPVYLFIRFFIWALRALDPDAV
jgi:hypothetical protein